MPLSTKTVLNFGNSHVSASVFSETNGNVVLQNAAMETLHYNLNDEQAWLDSSITALSKLIDKLKLKGDVHCVLPGSTLLSKTIRIPHVEKTKQKKIISFELSQKLPVPLTELIWDFSVIDDDGVEEEVLAYAVKPSIVESFCEKLIEIKLNPVLLTPAPILEYNLVKKSIQAGKYSDSKILAINVGAKSTNLLFIDENGFLIRTITIGGNMLTQNISDQLAIPFEKAETFKKNYFSGKISIGPEDPSYNIIQSSTGQHISRICQEITRAILHYKRVKKGNSPSEILITGRGTIIGGLSENLNQSIQLPVTRLDPYANLQVSEVVSEEMKALIPFMLSETTGLAHTLFNNQDNQKIINLLPSDKISALGFKRKVPWLVSSIFLLSLIPAPFIMNEIKTKENLVDLEAKQKKLFTAAQKEFEIKSQNQSELSSRKKLNNILHNKLLHYQPFTKESHIIIDALNFAQEIMDDPNIGDLWFDDFKFIKDNSGDNFVLFLSGRYLVRINSLEDGKSKADVLIEANSIKQNELNKKIENHQKFNRIIKKTFSTEGKGDLFNKQFSHFEYEISINRP